MAGKQQDDSTRISIPSSSSPRVPAKYRASIVIIKGHAAGMEYPVTRSYTVIGRDKNSDIAVKDDLVSRQHAAIIYGDGRFALKDLQSTNGTHMKGGLIEQVMLKHRDKFTIGETTIQFILEEQTAGEVYEIPDEDA